jgi:hypothetical protein
MPSPYRGAVLVPEPKPAPLRKWWRKTAWEWMAFGQAIGSLANVCKFAMHHEIRKVAFWAGLSVVWCVSGWAFRKRALKELRKEREYKELEARREQILKDRLLDYQARQAARQAARVHAHLEVVDGRPIVRF